MYCRNRSNFISKALTTPSFNSKSCALLKSKNIPTAKPLLCMDLGLLTISYSRLSWSKVDRALLQPDCTSFDTKLSNCGSRNPSTLVARMNATRKTIITVVTSVSLPTRYEKGPLMTIHKLITLKMEERVRESDRGWGHIIFFLRASEILNFGLYCDVCITFVRQIVDVTVIIETYLEFYISVKFRPCR